MSAATQRRSTSDPRLGRPCLPGTNGIVPSSQPTGGTSGQVDTARVHQRHLAANGVAEAGHRPVASFQSGRSLWLGRARTTRPQAEARWRRPGLLPASKTSTNVLNNVTCIGPRSLESNRTIVCDLSCPQGRASGVEQTALPVGPSSRPYAVWRLPTPVPSMYPVTPPVHNRVRPDRAPDTEVGALSRPGHDCRTILHSGHIRSRPARLANPLGVHAQPPNRYVSIGVSMTDIPGQPHHRNSVRRPRQDRLSAGGNSV